MITDKISTTVTHIDTKYRFTFHPSFGGTTGLIEIEVWENSRWSKGRWKRIYFGFITPIEGALQFFNKHLSKPIDQEKPRCPKCSDMFWIYEEDGTRHGCECHYL